MGNHRIARIVGLIQIHVASLESVWLSMLHNRVSLLKWHWLFILSIPFWELSAHVHFDGIIFNGTTLSIDTTTTYYLWPSPGALNFVVVVVARDIRGGSPKWPWGLVFRSKYHPRKTSCKGTFKTHPKHVFFQVGIQTLNKYFSVLFCSSWFTGGTSIVHHVQPI